MYISKAFWGGEIGLGYDIKSILPPKGKKKKKREGGNCELRIQNRYFRTLERFF